MQKAIAPKPRPCPQTWHDTLFDELKASAYRCKKERSVAFKIRHNAFPAGAHNHPLDTLVSCGGDTPPQTAPHSAPKILPSSALRGRAMPPNIVF